MDWEGQMILDGFTGTPRRQRTSRRKDISRKQSLLFGARIRKSSQYTTQLIPQRAQYLNKIGKRIPNERRPGEAKQKTKFKVKIVTNPEGEMAHKQQG
jgi:hypothetical protein